MKPSGVAPLGQLPILKVGDKTYCQSIPLSAYAAKLAGLYPSSPKEQLAVDEVVAITDELWNKIGSTNSKEPETRAAYGTNAATHLKALAARLEGRPFFHGDTPGWADLWVYQYCSFFASGFFDHVSDRFLP